MKFKKIVNCSYRVTTLKTGYFSTFLFYDPIRIKLGKIQAVRGAGLNRNYNMGEETFLFNKTKRN